MLLVNNNKPRVSLRPYLHIHSENVFICKCYTFFVYISVYLCIIILSNRGVTAFVSKRLITEKRKKMKTMKKLWILMAALTATLLLCVVSASACTMVYVGSNLTADGSSFMA